LRHRAGGARWCELSLPALLRTVELPRTLIRRLVMPKVGDKKFSYSKAGQKAAKTYAKKTGQKVKKAGTRKK
tara:strand:- start:4368 stop:4583 length:216 start_codon:yes stop_codon:yes gene_type:complete